MRVHIGTSGYSYKEWKGSFYPKDLPAKRMLSYYAERFAAVEINNTFYKLPEASVLEAWAAEVPDGFTFAFKAPQRITHFQRLKMVDDTLNEFLAVSRVVGKRAGPLLFQLPPNMKKDAGRLRDFLAALPAIHRVAFEFRHPSWFDDETFDLLRRRKAALCIADEDDKPPCPMEATAGWGYLRLRKAAYTDAQLKAWAKSIMKQEWDEAFVFFKHEDEAKGPKFAQKLLKIVG